MSSASQAPGDRLSALDAAFLYLERTGQLLHVGGLYPVAGALDFQRQLSDLAAPLDRRRPLWEVHQIDGYQGDRSVLFAKVHHCMIDGVSGVQLLGVMFDPSPNPAPPPPPAEAKGAPPLPSPAAQLTRVARDTLRGSVAAGRAL